MDDDELLDQLRDLVAKRRKIARSADTITGFLRQDVPEAIRRGLLTEVAAHELTGLSRTTIRAWPGKT